MIPRAIAIDVNATQNGVTSAHVPTDALPGQLLCVVETVLCGEAERTSSSVKLILVRSLLLGFTYPGKPAYGTAYTVAE